MRYINIAVERSRRNRGSITVESSIIVPIVILSITAVIYIGMLLYQRTVIQSAAEMAVDAGANAWSLGVCAIEERRPSNADIGKYNLYRRLFDSEGPEKLEIIKEYALEQASFNEMIRPIDSNVEVMVRDYALFKKMEVEITKTYKMPLGKFMKIFGGSDVIVMKVKATSIIAEPVELVRTTDFILDMGKELENKYPEIKNIGDKARKAISEISDKAGELIN